MSVYEKMTALADSIRAKTGRQDALSLEQMALDVAAAPAAVGDVPSYVRQEAVRVAQRVEALQHDNTLSFIGLSDLHINHENPTSPLHACQAAALIRTMVPIDFVASLGDVSVGAYNDSRETHLANLTAALRVMAVAYPEVRLDGNHDSNIYNAQVALSVAEVFAYIGRFADRAILRPESESVRNYGYWDITEKSTRVICLNTADLNDISPDKPQDGHHVSASQLAWLADTLDMTGKSGWRIIVLSHHPVHWYGAMENVLAVLDAYKAGESGSVTADGKTVTFDFSGKNAATLVGTFHGHTHNLISGNAGETNIRRMGTPNGGLTRTNEYGGAGYGDEFRKKYGEVDIAADGTLSQVKRYNKVENTAKDTAFCVYTVDFDTQFIHATCYGAGYDRELYFGDGVQYSVTHNLAYGILADNSTANVKEGESYSVSLTVRSDDYSFGNVKVTMGGVDITSSAYSNGVVTIAEVTGNIVITATASGFTNWVYKGTASDGTTIYNGTGYKDGYRLSTSNGVESQSTDMSVTGFIPLPDGGVLRIRDIDTSSANATYAMFDENFNFVRGGYCNNNFKTVDENGVSSWTTAYGHDGYIRISGDFGSTPVITVNENIVKADDDGNIYYTVKYQLSGAITSGNRETSVVKGSSYATSLTVADGYSFDGINVTMGGVDITDSVLTGYNILIVDVTGDIVINALAVSTSGDSSGQVDMTAIGYTDNKRISVSTGGLSTATGYTVTGLIDLFAYGKTAWPVTITVSGVSIDKSAHSNCWMHFYNADGTAATTAEGNLIGLGTTPGTSDTSHTVTDNGDGGISIMLTGAGVTQYCKLCMYGSGADAVITIS